MTDRNQQPSSHENQLHLRAIVEQEIRVRSSNDAGFRQALKADPRAVLEREYPQWFPAGELPEDLSIQIIEEEERTLSLVLLPQKQMLSQEGMQSLEDEELDAVAGGGGCCSKPTKVKPQICIYTRSGNTPPRLLGN